MANNWYMVNATGDPQVGWQKDNGYMATGWVKNGETWYYCNADGSMAANITIDGYQLGSNGAWIG